MSELAVIEIKPEQAPALYVANGLDAYLEQIRVMAQEVPDVTTKKGRDRIGSLARSVGSSKKAIEEPGRLYLKHLKEAVKPAEEELRRFTRECDAIRDAILKSRDEWEAEQERLRKEEEERLEAEAYSKMRDEADRMNEDFDVAKAEARKIKFEADHELALLMDKDIDRERADKAAEAERQRIAHEEEIKRQAEEKAKREAAEKAQREIDAAAAREREALLAKERAEREQREAVEKAERDRIAAEQKAEADKQAAIDAERRKAQEEADRIRREAEEREQARLAEEKRKADEQARREADVKHRKAVGTDIVKALLAHTSLTREQAIEVLTAIKDGNIPHTGISY